MGGRQPAAEAVAPAPIAYRPTLYSAPFIGLCLIALFGFGQNFVLQPTLPLLVIGMGGDATLVGVVFLVFSVPSVVLRPYIGRMADRFGTRRVLLLGAAGTAIAGPLYFVSSIFALLALRVAHGTAWAAFNTGGPGTMASLAPASRRGEASAAFDLMPGLAILTMPTVALILYGSFGITAPLLLATAFGIATLAVCLWLVPPSVGAAPAKASSGGALLERSAVLPMIFQLLLNAALPLFVVYPPLFAAALGLPLTDLVLYYPVYGIVFLVARLGAGRVVDRFPRERVLIAGAALAGLSLLIAASAGSILVLTIAGVLYGVANGSTAPATTALVMDRAPEGRVGAAMATYTLGFQFGSGLGAALWGFVIAWSGFTLSFVLAAAFQFLLLAIVVRGSASLARPALP